MFCFHLPIVLLYKNFIHLNLTLPSYSVTLTLCMSSFTTSMNPFLGLPLSVWQLHLQHLLSSLSSIPHLHMSKTCLSNTVSKLLNPHLPSDLHIHQHIAIHFQFRQKISLSAAVLVKAVLTKEGSRSENQTINRQNK